MFSSLLEQNVCFYVSRAHFIFCNLEQQKSCYDATCYKRVCQLCQLERKEFFNRRQVRLFQINLEYTDNYYVQISQSHYLQIALIS